MKKTIAELLNLVDKIDSIRLDLSKMGGSVCDEAASLLWDYRDVILQTKVEV